jgi:uncharacterized protein (TIGR01244 family)
VQIGKLSEDYFISGQIEPEHVPMLAEHGFKTIICNRPDGEDAGQPTAEEIRTAAAENGIAFLHIPVVPPGVSPQNMQDFKDKYDEIATPVLMYCRTGTRCAMLYQLAGVD